MISAYAVINNANIVTNVVAWDGVTPWTPNDYQAVDANGVPVGDPTPQTAVPDTEPQTAQIGYSVRKLQLSFYGIGFACLCRNRACDINPK